MSLYPVSTWSYPSSSNANDILHGFIWEVRTSTITFLSIFIYYYLSLTYSGGLELFLDLLQRFPNNIHLLLEIAKVGSCDNKSKIIDVQSWETLSPKHILGSLWNGMLKLDEVPHFSLYWSGANICCLWLREKNFHNCFSSGYYITFMCVLSFFLPIFCFGV